MSGPPFNHESTLEPEATPTTEATCEPSGQRPAPVPPPDDLIGMVVPDAAFAWSRVATRKRCWTTAVALNWWRHHSQAILVAGALAVSVGVGWIGAWYVPRLLEDLQSGKQVHREDLACSADKRSWTVAEARAYLLQTANPSYTMVKQGAEFAINRLHPGFAVRLAEALREARDSGLSSAGIYSAYRPPAFGVGGFSDKFNSLHAYGLALDLYGIGRPGSAEARRWHAVAASHGVICPYGPYHKTEWNHCQPTALKKIWTRSPLRDSITANGPVSLAAMFEAGDSIVGSLTNAAENDTQAQPAGLNAQASRTCPHSLADSEEVPVLYGLYGLLPGQFSFKESGGWRS